MRGGRLVQREFLNSFAMKYGITHPKDWEKITSNQIKNEGGSFLLQIHSRSLKRMLVKNFPEKNFSTVTFNQKTPSTYWDSIPSQREFMLSLLGESSLQGGDWKKITANKIRKAGGFVLLNKYGGPRKIFRALFPEYNLQSEDSHPTEYWNSHENQRRFLNEFAKKNNIRNTRDWGSITVSQIENAGGSGLLAKFGKSPSKMLHSIFPDILWKKEWFRSSRKYPPQFWESNENCRKFLDSLLNSSQALTSPSWKRISASLVRNSGGEGLLRRYKYSLTSAINALYPFLQMNSSSEINSSPQKSLQNLIIDIFPDAALFYNKKGNRILSA